MKINKDIELAANKKIAGIMDSIGGLLGNEGSVSMPLMGMGGAALGGMAGRGLGMGPIGTGIGALLGGGMAGIGSNAINKQNMFQNNMDMALINGISSGLNANDHTDMQQNHAIAQTNETLNGIMGLLEQVFAPSMAEDPGMGMGMGMGMEQMPPMGQMAPPAPMQGQIPNNGLGKQGSLNYDINSAVATKLARLSK